MTWAKGGKDEADGGCSLGKMWDGGIEQELQMHFSLSLS